MKTLDKLIQEQFPLAKKITYLDSSALVLKPKMAIDAVNNFYLNESISTRTINTKLGIESAQKINNLRKKVATLLSCQEQEVIFTSGATDSLNKFALMIKNQIKKGDIILLDVYNHSSNMAPWIKIANEIGASVKISQNVLDDLNSKVKIVAVSQVSNSFENNIDLNAIYKKAKKFNTLVVNDAAQAIVYERVSLNNCDAIAFSSNKFYGPTGFGVLAVKKEILQKLEAPFVGGGIINNIDSEKQYTLSTAADRFEAGTPNLAAINMFSVSINFFNQIGYCETQKILDELSFYAYQELSKIEGIKLYSNPKNHIIIFNIKNYNSHDVSHYLGTKNIYVRAGVFCDHYLKKITKEKSFVRVSLGIYNTKKDIDKLVKALKEGGDFLVL
ncbi:hypothetical protein MBIO_0217 [Mycoplasmopsis fermentans PG18]|uniref:Aminotransferase class V domain-containing protein n=2 Tax=Mycoplasmopsis fermentans TaxID=2115 RepID=C4XEB0_MYCFP|nr:aminotransferase class V-fold PLP-dependent enzyme [Mycoplasmopsis fermentans]ADV34180.1 Nitrogen fixation protein NifS [Mycoplasmopsis fermentans M64]BAH69482.1 hypothetical protein MBIO_0217 [Mycoplasmopsis fermentans PG18]VEU60210.1 Probable cysteine desulfurase [Mycoplasmopsis fermentans]VEU67677.1 Probable cysteine desulfurase [Mesomycoplasma conjunctivae]